MVAARYSEVHKRIGARIRELIDQQYPFVSDSEIAARAGMSRSGLSGLIRGKYNVTLTTLDSVRQALGASWADFDVPPKKGRARVRPRIYPEPLRIRGRMLVEAR